MDVDHVLVLGLGRTYRSQVSDSCDPKHTDTPVDCVGTGRGFLRDRTHRDRFVGVKSLNHWAKNAFPVSDVLM